MPIQSLLPQRHAFGPEDIIVLSRALEDTLRSLQVADRNDEMATTVARHIIDLASHGERDPIRLRDSALQCLAK
jgi:hypothetical protein